ncbi:MAG: cupin domain-containing protein [Chloroflexi bacterium]|nr:MAG: cupin domain-containing protein [Chloroflexota bacterium]
MGDYDAMELQGAERQEVLEKISGQIRAWGLVMPDVTPIPLHFGLDNFYETGETEFWVANERERGYCGKFLFVFDGQTCPFHYHKMKHETFFVLKGAVRMCTSTGDNVLKSGDTFVMPPGMGHSFTGIGPALLLEVSMPSILNDNFFADSRIGQNGVI